MVTGSLQRHAMGLCLHLHFVFTGPLHHAVGLCANYNRASYEPRVATFAEKETMIFDTMYCRVDTHPHFSSKLSKYQDSVVKPENANFANCAKYWNICADSSQNMYIPIDF